jgi:hypothetical protein
MEHIHSIKQNKESLNYEEHILDARHERGRVEETMDILKTTPAGRAIDTWE